MIRSAIAFLIFVMATPMIGQSSLSSSIDNILSAEAFEYATAGISVRTLSGKEVFSNNGDKKCIPASSLKLITTLAAIDILGEEYQYKTKIGYSGALSRDGSLQGDIVIIGGGDPTMGSPRFGKENSTPNFLQKIVAAVKAKGITCIDGAIEVRTNVFSGQAIPGNWPLADISNYYASGAWAVNINENMYKLYFKNGKMGSTAQVQKIVPDIPYLDIQSEVEIKDAKSGDNAYIYGDETNYRKVVRGSIPFSKKPFVIKGAIPNPPLSMAMLLGAALEKSGIEVGSHRVVSTPIRKEDFNLLLAHSSHSLSKIAKQANYESINIYCDSFLRLIGKKKSGEGSIEKGLESLEKIMEEKGLDKHGYHIEDGSGLSPRNSIAPSIFTAYLSASVDQKSIEKIVRYIPQTGVSGTVSTLLKGKKSQKKYYLKSGSMGGVLSYTGYFRGSSHQWYAVSFMSNNHSHGNSVVRREAEKIFEILYQNL